MSNQNDARRKLQRLAELLKEERECAKSLDLEGMAVATREKAALIGELPPLENPGPQDLALARTIRAENRRNAYLFWSTLKWIRASMEFFGKQASPKGYDSAGSLVTGNCHGRLLSGKV